MSPDLCCAHCVFFGGLDWSLRAVAAVWPRAWPPPNSFCPHLTEVSSCPYHRITERRKAFHSSSLCIFLQPRAGLSAPPLVALCPPSVGPSSSQLPGLSYLQPAAHELRLVSRLSFLACPVSLSVVLVSFSHLWLGGVFLSFLVIQWGNSCTYIIVFFWELKIMFSVLSVVPRTQFLTDVVCYCYSTFMVLP